MSQHGATLQTYNQELVKCLEDLKTKRNEMLIIVKREEQEKQVIERNINALQEQLTALNANLHKHKSLCDSYEKTIHDTESGFKKILESSHTLLSLAQQKASTLTVVKKGDLCPNMEDTNVYRCE